MPTFRLTRRVPHSPRQMYDLVAKVEDYPRFLPLCEALTVLHREPLGSGERLTANMTVAYGPVRETFTSRVELDPGPPRVHVSYIDGPFRHMENRWNFRDVTGGGCDVEFFIDYEFRSFLLQALMGAMFDKAFHKYAEAFEARAVEVYGRAGA